MIRVIGIRHIGIETDNMEEMIKFYEKLGLQVYWDEIEQPDHTGFDEPVRTVKMFCKDNSTIELTTNHKYKNHFALDVKGTETKTEWIEDPDGNMIEVVNNDKN